jgi:hypothetical protein
MARAPSNRSFALDLMYRVTVVCHGVTPAQGAAAVPDMLTEFAGRPWQQNPMCTWVGGVLRFSAESEGDSNGLALLDEFWDAVHAYLGWFARHFHIKPQAPKTYARGV